MAWQRGTIGGNAPGGSGIGSHRQQWTSAEPGGPGEELTKAQMLRRALGNLFRGIKGEMDAGYEVPKWLLPHMDKNWMYWRFITIPIVKFVAAAHRLANPYIVRDMHFAYLVSNCPPPVRIIQERKVMVEIATSPEREDISIQRARARILEDSSVIYYLIYTEKLPSSYYSIVRNMHDRNVRKPFLGMRQIQMNWDREPVTQLSGGWWLLSKILS